MRGKSMPSEEKKQQGRGADGAESRGRLFAHQDVGEWQDRASDHH